MKSWELEAKTYDPSKSNIVGRGSLELDCSCVTSSA
jgi:hypothetical protein